MHITNPMHQPMGNAYQPPFKCPPFKSRFKLTRTDRMAIERILRLDLTARCPNPTLMAGFLRHKLRLASPSSEPTPANLVTVGRHVSFMISGGSARSGLLCMEPDDTPGCIPVTSFLGATLLGMQRLQKGPLLREDGLIDVLVVLDVRAV